MNKKAQDGGTMSIITKAIIVIVVLLVLLFIFQKFFGQGANIIDAEVCGLDYDHDGDGIVDLADNCPCDKDEPSKCPTTAEDCRAQISQSDKCKSRR